MNYRGQKPTEKQQYWIDRYVNMQVEISRNESPLAVRRHILGLQGINSFRHELKVYFPFGVDTKKFMIEQDRRIVEEIFKPMGFDVFTAYRGSLILDEEGIVAVFYRDYDDTIHANYTLLSSDELHEEFKKRFEAIFDQTKPPSMRRIRINRQKDELYAWSEVINVRPVLENPMDMYPFLDQSPEELWNGFKESESNVLILIGPPGTGKSNYINEILRHRGYDDQRIYLADQDNVLQHADLTSFIRGVDDNSIIITEDSDKMVAKRTDGNSNMSGLLNATAGLVSTNTKIIISTNLPTTRDIDEALLRPGRAYKILKFRSLNREEANRARLAAGKEIVDFTSDSITLAEALNFEQDSTNRKAHGIGFN